jgi:hypothetical protein
MALPITVPFTFGNATTTQSLSSLDADFSTVYNAVNGIGNGTVSLANVSITGGTISANLSASGIFSGTSNVSITSANGAVSINTNGTNALYIDASQNVGIGTTSPATLLHVSNASAAIRIGLTASSQYTDIYRDGATGFTIYNAAQAATFRSHVWQLGGTEAARIDSSGNLLVGTTSQIQAGSKLSISGIASSGFGPLSMSNPSFPSRTWSTGPEVNGAYVVYNAASAGVYITYGNTAWTANSDERLKTDLVPIENAASKVSSLRAVTGRFKTDEEGKSRSFLIAQDVQAVLPEAVDSTNPDKLGVQYTEVIPLLVAAIKELSAKNDALEARLVALESK